MIVGNKIRERREELGMAQDELASQMGYKSRSTIAKIEKGVNDVTQTNLLKFAEVLNTTPRYLMGWEDEQNKNSAIVPLISIMREDDTFLNLTEEFYKKRDKIAPIVSLMCADDKFLNMVWDLASLDDEKRDSISGLFAVFKDK